MATYEEMYNIVSQPTADFSLWRKAYWAILKAAFDIRNEGGGVPNHAARLAWAIGEAEPNTEAELAKMRPTIVWDGDVQADPGGVADADVQDAVNGWILANIG